MADHNKDPRVEKLLAATATTNALLKTLIEVVGDLKDSLDRIRVTERGAACVKVDQ